MQDGRAHTILEIAYDSTLALRDDDHVGRGRRHLGCTGHGLNSRTDALEAIQEFHYSGKNVTQHNYSIDSQAEYVTLYRYNGNTLINKVYPEGDRSTSRGTARRT